MRKRLMEDPRNSLPYPFEDMGEIEHPSWLHVSLALDYIDRAGGDLGFGNAPARKWLKRAIKQLKVAREKARVDW